MEDLWLDSSTVKVGNRKNRKNLSSHFGGTHANFNNTHTNMNILGGCQRGVTSAYWSGAHENTFIFLGVGYSLQFSLFIVFFCFSNELLLSSPYVSPAHKSAPKCWHEYPLYGHFHKFTICKRNVKDFLILGIDYLSSIWHTFLEFQVLTALQLYTNFSFSLF